MGLGIKLDRAAAIQSLVEPAVVAAVATMLFGPTAEVTSQAAASIANSPIGKLIVDAVGSVVKVAERDKEMRERLAEAVEESQRYAFDIVGDEAGSTIWTSPGRRSSPVR